MIRRQLLMLVLVTALLPPAVRADEVEGSEQARAALEAGEIKPLAGLLASVESRYAGHLIETELEREHGRWLYEFKVLPGTGHIFSVTVDAATGKVVATHGPVLEQP